MKPENLVSNVRAQLGRLSLECRVSSKGQGRGQELCEVRSVPERLAEAGLLDRGSRKDTILRCKDGRDGFIDVQ